MQKIESDRVISIILAIILVLFASLAAPKLPRSITKYLENPWLRFIIFIGIAYMATHDLVTAIIAVIAVLVSYQTLSIHKITDTIMDKTTELMNTIPFPIQSQVYKPVQQPVYESVQNQLLKPVQQPVYELEEPVYKPVQQPVYELEEPVYKPVYELEEPVYKPFYELEEPVYKPVQQPDYKLIQQHVYESTQPVYESTQPVYESDELNNQISFYTKDTILKDPAIDNTTIINSLIVGNPNLDPVIISDFVNKAYFEELTKKESINNILVDKMPINNNDILFKTHRNYTKKNTMKYLKGDNVLLPDDYSEPNIILLDDINGSPNLLTDKCTTKHQQNFNCNNIPKNANENFNGFEYDFENYGAI